ncbi:hypothetical protein, partial [Actinomadura sp. CNU-125]|uniref:hypothetical protein n=1 Tax=Actinomadura sp. CNU-125 TaxID=1904961 RepID=UPI0011787519
MTTIREPLWPVAGGCLAAAAVAEAVLRAGGTGQTLPLALVLDVSATLPLVLLRRPAAAFPGDAAGRGPAAAVPIAVMVAPSPPSRRPCCTAARRWPSTPALAPVWAVL